MYSDCFSKICGVLRIKKVLIFSIAIILIMIAKDGFCDDILTLVEEMSTRELIGQKLIVGPPWLLTVGSKYYVGDDEKYYSEEYLKKLIQKYAIVNFYLSRNGYRDWMAFREKNRCLFSNNKDFPRMNSRIIRNEAGYIRTIVESRAENRTSPFIFVDFEGGRVQSIRGSDLPNTPSPMNVAATRDLNLALNYSRAIGKLLRNLSINGNFAPVVDINYEGFTSLIGTRAFGSSPELVTDMAHSFLLGQIESGIAPVLKHWPGHGSVLKIPEGADINVNFHQYTEPLEVKTSVHAFKHPYKKLLENELIKKHAAIMTSHLIVEDYKDGCANNGKTKTITFCKYAIDQLRKENDFQNGVVIADDIAYLRAVRKYSLYEILKNTFDADHDMVIIASLVPSYHYWPYRDDEKYKCKEEYIINDNSISLENLEYAINKLEEYYNDDDRKRVLKQSVVRILNWKKHLNLLNKTIGDNLKQHVKIDKYDQLKGDMLILYKDIIKSSVVLISPRDKSHIDNFQTELKINKEHKLIVVGPTLITNDLKKVFNEIKEKKEKTEFPQLIHHELPYRDSALEDSKQFIDDHLEYLWHLTIENKPDFLIYGLINKPAHLEIWKRLRLKIKELDRPPKLILICFHVPSVLTTDDFDSSDIVLATFSNHYYANKNVVEMICDISGRTPKAIKYLPVDILPVYRVTNWSQNGKDSLELRSAGLASKLSYLGKPKPPEMSQDGPEPDTHEIEPMQPVPGGDSGNVGEFSHGADNVTIPIDQKLTIRVRVIEYFNEKQKDYEYIFGILFIFLSTAVFMFLCSGSNRKKILAGICIFIACFLYTFAGADALSRYISNFFKIDKLIDDFGPLVTSAVVGFFMPITIYLVIFRILKRMRKDGEETVDAGNEPKPANAGNELKPSDSAFD